MNIQGKAFIEIQALVDELEAYNKQLKKELERIENSDKYIEVNGIEPIEIATSIINWVEKIYSGDVFATELSDDTLKKVAEHILVELSD